uniref:Uncharacterized protein n=1 Tax=Geobacter sp. (strain M21) TaxID=443144 RepID=C6E3Q3_GEOSM
MTTKCKTKEVTVTVSNEKALSGMSEKERGVLLCMADKIFSDLQVTFKDGAPVPAKGKPADLPYALLLELCKTASVNGALQTVSNAGAGQYWNQTDTNLAVAFTQIADLAPQTPLEAMLISQMVAVNTAIGKTMYRAMLPEQTPYGKESNMGYATKLQRVFLQQIEALQKLRGKGQQTVRVEHVTVNAGGQAIVGNVEH